MSVQLLPSHQDVRVLPMGAEVQLICRGTAADHRLQVTDIPYNTTTSKLHSVCGMLQAVSACCSVPWLPSSGQSSHILVSSSQPEALDVHEKEAGGSKWNHGLMYSDMHASACSSQVYCLAKVMRESTLVFTNFLSHWSYMADWVLRHHFIDMSCPFK